MAQETQTPPAETGNTGGVQEGGQEGAGGAQEGQEGAKAPPTPAKRSDARRAARDKARSRFGRQPPRGDGGKWESRQQQQEEGSEPAGEAGEEPEGQQDDQDGQQEGQAAPEGEKVQDGEAPAGEGSPEDAQQDAGAGDEPAQSWVEVELEEDHPLRAQGIEKLRVHPDDERHVRALNNGTYTRRKENEELRAQLEELKQRDREAKREKIRQEAAREVQEKVRETPEYKAAVQEYTRIKKEVGDKAAKRYWQSVQAELKSAVDKRADERWGEVEEQEAKEAAQRFQGSAWQRTEAIPAEIRQLPKFRSWFEENMEALDREIGQGLHPELTDQNLSEREAEELVHQKFAAMFRKRLSRQPEVQPILRQLAEKRAGQGKGESNSGSPDAPKKTEEQIRKEAIEEYKKQVAEGRAENPPHPMGRVGSGMNRDESESKPEGEGDDEHVNPVRARRNHRQAAREAARRRFQR